MNDLETFLSTRTVKQPPAIMAHLVAGFPSYRESLDIGCALVEGGASLLEIQIPFSDPIGDGPTIMAANDAALKLGTRPADALKLAAELRRRTRVPILIMTYCNIALQYPGAARGFCKAAASSGVSGIIIPDILPENSRDRIWSEAAKHNLAAIPLITPLSSPERIQGAAKKADGGFIYCVTSTGTTGVRKGFQFDMNRYLARARKSAKCPLAVGFGISSRAQVQGLSGKAEIAIVGSASIQLIRETAPKRRNATLVRFMKELSRA